VKYVNFLTGKYVNTHKQAYYNGPFGSGAIVTQCSFLINNLGIKCHRHLNIRQQKKNTVHPKITFIPQNQFVVNNFC